MNTDKQIIITIGREYGSAGHEIGRKLAEHFHMPLYDRSILEEVAVIMGVDPEELHKYDEKPKRRLFSRTVRGYSNSNSQAIAEMQFDLMREKEAIGQSFVVVGRCADYLFRDNKGLVSIFITADYKDKLERVMDKRNLSVREAANAIVRHDKSRKAYHNSFCESHWGHSRSYNLVINSSKLGIDGTVEFIEDYVERFAKTL